MCFWQSTPVVLDSVVQEATDDQGSDDPLEASSVTRAALNIADPSLALPAPGFPSQAPGSPVQRNRVRPTSASLPTTRETLSSWRGIYREGCGHVPFTSMNG